MPLATSKKIHTVKPNLMPNGFKETFAKPASISHVGSLKAHLKTLEEFMKYTRHEQGQKSKLSFIDNFR